MRDIYFQIRRGLTWKTVLCCCFLLFYALLFPNFDFPAMFNDPIAFFQSEHFFYHFTIFFRSDMLRYIVPIVAILPLGFFFAEDQTSRFGDMEAGRLSIRSYVIHRIIAALIASTLVILLCSTVFIGILWFISAPVMAPNSAAKAWMDSYALSPFAVFGTMEHLLLHVAWRLCTILIAAYIWIFFAVALSFLWSEKIFVFLGTFAGSILIDNLLGQLLGIEYTIAFLMSPDFMVASSSIRTYLLREELYLFIAGGLCCIIAFLRFFRPVLQRLSRFHLKYREHARCTWSLPGPQRIRGTALSRLLVDTYANCSLKTLLPAIVIPLFILACKSNVLLSQHSTGDLLMHVFGGLYWFDPVVNFGPIGYWLLVLMPAMLGVAINLEREIGTRMYICVQRYPSPQRWWLSKYMACNLYIVVLSAVMFATVIVASVFTGVDHFGIWMPDADGFPIENSMVLFQLFHIFTWQLLMLTQIQLFFHVISNHSHIGFLAHLLPLLFVMISYSIFDRTQNVLVPYQWGIILRSELFSPSYMLGAEGTRISLCATDLSLCLYGQMIVTILLGGLNGVLGRFIKFQERRQNT